MRSQPAVVEPRSIAISAPDTGDEEWQALREPLETGWLTQGPKVMEFEKAFAKIHRTRYAVASSSCTTALHLTLTALGIQPGDEVIVPAFTWISTANVVLYCGATPIFVDTDKATYNINPELLEEKITSKTKAIIPVHLFGLCADMNKILKLASGIPVVEDAACAAGGQIQGKMAGSLGIAGAFSFHPRKVISTGEGGMITSNDETLAMKTRSLRNHGATVSEEDRHQNSKPYQLPEFPWLGFNYRMTDLQGAMGLVQLEKLERLIKERQQWASFYTRELADISWLSTPTVPKGYFHTWQSYVCMIHKKNAPMSRDNIMQQLHEKGISARPGTHAVHLQKFYQQKFNLKPGDFPVAQECDAQSLALPLHSRMTSEDFAYVVKTLKEIR